MVPEVWALKKYREAAAAIPPELRETVRSIEAGRILSQRVKDVRDRHKLIQKLTNEKGIVTVRAVREHFDMSSKDGPITGERLLRRSEEERARDAAWALRDPKVAQQAVEQVLRTSSDAGRAIEKAVEKTKREKAQRNTEARESRARRKAVPFPAAMARMITKIGDWAGDLAYWYDELDTLPAGADRDQLGKTVRQLEHQAKRWADRIQEIVLEELDENIAIEGTAHDITDEP